MDRLKYYRFDVGGWTEQAAAAAVGVAVKTYRRYEARRAPLAVLRLVALLAAGELGLIHPAWDGWNLIRGELVSPENMIFTPGDVAAIPYREALVATLRRDLAAHQAPQPAQRELFEVECSNELAAAVLRRK